MIDVAIVGVSGYTGLELVKILHNHPHFNITYVGNTTGETDLISLHPSLAGVVQMSVEATDAKAIATKASLAFLALPHKASMGLASQLIELGVKVVDLSADYRLELEKYEEYYTLHEDKKNLSKAVYGLPEYYKDALASTDLVANPGCYPTATLLGLLPFAEYIDTNAPIFVDAKSGVSGSGKKLTELNTYVMINENIFAYNPIKHRHAPEIAEKLSKIKGVEAKINFVPHLLPVTRGMLVSIYATLKEDIDPIAILKEAYKDEKMVRIRENPVDIKSTAGTNFCDIYAIKNGDALIISSSIDNLLRGASSQAVVNANIMCGFESDTGINHIAYVP